MAYNNGRANVVHLASCRCQRLSRLVLAHEIYTVAKTFDSRCVIQESLAKMSGCSINIGAYVDSRTVLRVVPKDSNIAGEGSRLMCPRREKAIDVVY